MGKMKALMIEQQEQQDKMDFNTLMEESHYRHTIHDFVELIVVYGYDKVIGDLRAAMGEKTW